MYQLYLLDKVNHCLKQRQFKSVCSAVVFTLTLNASSVFDAIFEHHQFCAIFLYHRF